MVNCEFSSKLAALNPEVVAQNAHSKPHTPAVGTWGRTWGRTELGKYGGHQMELRNVNKSTVHVEIILPRLANVGGSTVRAASREMVLPGKGGR